MCGNIVTEIISAGGVGGREGKRKKNCHEERLPLMNRKMKPRQERLANAKMMKPAEIRYR